MTTRIKPIEFINLYRQANSLAEMSQITGMTVAAIKNRASYYRNRGIDLPYFRLPSGRALDELRQKVATND